MLNNIKDIIPNVDEGKSDLIYQKAMLKKYKKKPLFFKVVLIPILSLLLVISIILPISLNNDKNSDMNDTQAPLPPSIFDNINQDTGTNDSMKDNVTSGSCKTIYEAMAYVKVTEALRFNDYELQPGVSYYLYDDIYGITYYYGNNGNICVNLSNSLEYLDIDNKTKEYLNKEEYVLDNGFELDIYYHKNNNEQMKSAICIYTYNSQYYLIKYNLYGKDAALDIYNHILQSTTYII